MLTKKTIRDYDIAGKKVLVRVDYNVPIDDDGNITDAYRVEQSLETINYLREQGCRIILISHLGRPDGKSNPAYSLRPVVDRLSQMLGGVLVQFADDCIGEQAKVLAEHLQPGQVLLLENLRFHAEEEANDELFARSLIEASGAEIFVQDGFGVVHRAHASTDAITRLLPSVAGILLDREINTIENAMSNPERPLAVILGGAKISDKIEILNKFIEIADFVAVTGAMANTFLAATGVPIGVSLSEESEIETAKDIIDKAHQKASDSRFTFFLPRDVVVAKEATSNTATRIVDLSFNAWADINSYPKRPARESYQVAEDENILDIGPFSAAYIAGAVKLAATAIWNGACGMTEIKGLAGAANPFSHATEIVVEGLIGESADEKNHPFTIVGGGDTVGYVESVSGLRERFGHVSTGGGASLDLMAGKPLPGVVNLLERD